MFSFVLSTLFVWLCVFLIRIAGRISESLSDLSSSPYFSISHPSLCPITVFDPLQYASQRSDVDPLLFAKPGTLRRGKRFTIF